MKQRVNLFLLFIFVILILFLYLFGPEGFSNEVQILVVPQNQTTFDIAKELKEKKLIRSEKTFSLVRSIFFPFKKIQSGGYRLSQNMSVVTIVKKILSDPDLVWITMTSCLRKEQIGEILAHYLKWDAQALDRWNTVYTRTRPEYLEGVYYPDTYLIPANEPADKVAQRLINRFNEQFAPLSSEFVKQNIKWTTGLKIASLIAREAAGKQDMNLISGIIWNRLNIGMPLQIDATMQYTRGKDANGKWWGTIDIGEKLNDSPYNSYLYKGLPPTPICSPNIDYIRAVLYPEETSCLFYLHDRAGAIHCAKTYEEHLDNIDLYLNN